MWFYRLGYIHAWYTFDWVPINELYVRETRKLHLKYQFYGRLYKLRYIYFRFEVPQFDLRLNCVDIGLFIGIVKPKWHSAESYFYYNQSPSQALFIYKRLKLWDDFRCFRSKTCFRTFITMPLNSPMGRHCAIGNYILNIDPLYHACQQSKYIVITFCSSSHQHGLTIRFIITTLT